MATTVNQPIVLKDNSNANIITFPVGNGEVILKGTAAAITAAGYLAPITSGNKATNTMFVMPIESLTATANGVISSTGEADDNCVKGYVSGIVKLTVSGMTIANVGDKLYATDNYAFTTTGPNNTFVGTIVQFISATVVYVDLNKAYLQDGSIEITGSLTAGTATTGGSTISVANPLTADVLVEEFITKITTKSTGAATIDFGIATDGTTSSDLLLDGINAETVGYSTIGVNGGTNGKYGRIWLSTSFITGTPSASTVGMVGTYKAVIRKY